MRRTWIVLPLLLACVPDLLDGLACPCADGWTCNAESICVEGTADASTDAAVEDGTTPDAPIDVEKTCWLQSELCDWLPGTFELVATADVPSGRMGNFAFSPDGCELYAKDYDLDDLFVMRRTTPGTSFGAAELLDGINTSASEDKGTVAPRQLEIFFTSDRAGLGTLDVYRSERVADGDRWGGAALVAELSQPGTDTFDISLAPHGLNMYFARPGSPTQDLFVARRADGSMRFEAPQRIAVVSGSGDTAEPSVTADGRVLTYVERIDSTFTARYATRDDQESEWVARGPIPSPSFSGTRVTEAIISPDGCEVIADIGGSQTRLLHRSL